MNNSFEEAFKVDYKIVENEDRKEKNVSTTILESCLYDEKIQINFDNLDSQINISNILMQNNKDISILKSSIINLDDNIEIEYLEKKNIENKYPKEK